jgi:hypothetical protein
MDDRQEVYRKMEPCYGKEKSYHSDYWRKSCYVVGEELESCWEGGEVVQKAL